MKEKDTYGRGTDTRAEGEPHGWEARRGTQEKRGEVRQQDVLTTPRHIAYGVDSYLRICPSDASIARRLGKLQNLS